LTSQPISLEVVIAAADLNTTEESDAIIRRVKCPAFIKFYNSTFTKFDMTHNHCIPQDMTTYVISRKQEPEVMQRIYSGIFLVLKGTIKALYVLFASKAK
jgi:hypothetical protein